MQAVLKLESIAFTPIAQYPSGGLRLVTVGTDLSKAFSQMWSNFLNHDHHSVGSMLNNRINHDTLLRLYNPSGMTPALEASGLDADGHPQYLHRSGYNASRDSFNNAMLGDLLMASTSSSSSYNNNAADSRKVSFGNNSTGPYIFFDKSEEALTLFTSDASHGITLDAAETIFCDAPTCIFGNISTSTQVWIRSGNRIAIETYGGDVDIDGGHITMTSSAADGPIEIETSNKRIAIGGGSDFFTYEGSETNDIVIEAGSDDVRIYSGDTIELQAQYGGAVNINTEGDNSSYGAGNTIIGRTTDYGNPEVLIRSGGTGDISLTSDDRILLTASSRITLASDEIRQNSASRTYAIGLKPISGMGQSVHYVDIAGPWDEGWACLNTTGSDPGYALVPWTVGSSGYFYTDPEQDTGSNRWNIAPLVCILSEIPEGTVTSLQIDWDPSHDGNTCTVYRWTFGGSASNRLTYTVGAETKDTTRHQPVLDISDEYLDKSSEVLALVFSHNTGYGSSPGTWIIYPVCKVTVTYDVVDPYDTK